MSEDCIGIDTYGYPQATIYKDVVRISFGWFFVDDADENQPASYVDITIDTDGKALYSIDVYSSFLFNFITPLRDYGFWEDHGFGKYFVYADHHIPKKEQLKHFIKNLPWQIKRWSYWHVPLVKRISSWRYQRYCRRLFKC